MTSLIVVEHKRYVKQDSFIHEHKRYVTVTETEFKYFKMGLLYYVLGSVFLIVSRPVVRTTFKNSSCYVRGICGARMRFVWGTRCHSWLRHCPISRKVAGSVPDGIFMYLDVEIAFKNTVRKPVFALNDHNKNPTTYKKSQTTYATINTCAVCGCLEKSDKIIIVQMWLKTSSVFFFGGGGHGYLMIVIMRCIKLL